MLSNNSHDKRANYVPQSSRRSPPLVGQVSPAQSLIPNAGRAPTRTCRWGSSHSRIASCKPQRHGNKCRVDSIDLWAKNGSRRVPAGEKRSGALGRWG